MPDLGPDAFREVMIAGGAVMVPLLGLAALLWYGIGYRILTLRRSIVARCAWMAEIERREGPSRLHERVRIRVHPVRQELSSFSSAVRSAVILAPLLGLLGTVTGMIETFDSLQSMAMYTQGGGIAAGIGQALFTTQLGLVVAVPGHVVGRLLDRKQEQLEQALDEIVDGAAAVAA